MAIGGSVHPTSVVDPSAELGRAVTVGAYAVINANVSVGDGSFVDAHAVLGATASGYYSDPEAYDPEPCRIGQRAVIRSHCSLYAGVTIGDDFSCGHHVTIREGCQFGDGVQVGTLCDVQPDVMIGDHARLHSNVFVARGSVIEGLTWLFPHAVLIDDPHPPSDECTQGPTIRKFAAVGAGSTIFPAVEVGEGALIAAMSLVRQDVPPHTVVAGVPAKSFGPTADVVCHEGRIEQLYPWWRHFRRGYPDGVLPPAGDSGPGA